MLTSPITSIRPTGVAMATIATRPSASETSIVISALRQLYALSVGLAMENERPFSYRFINPPSTFRKIAFPTCVPTVRAIERAALLTTCSARLCGGRRPPLPEDAGFDPKTPPSRPPNIPLKPPSVCCAASAGAASRFLRLASIS